MVIFFLFPLSSLDYSLEKGNSVFGFVKVKRLSQISIVMTLPYVTGGIENRMGTVPAGEEILREFFVRFKLCFYGLTDLRP